MYLHVSNTKNGTYLAFYESYRDKVTKKPKNRCVEPIGYLLSFTARHNEKLSFSA